MSIKFVSQIYIYHCTSNQSSPLLHLKLCVLSHYYMPHLEKGTFWLHYQLHAQLYLEAKERTTLIVWKKGDKPV